MTSTDSGGSLTRLTASELAEKLQAGEVAAVEVTQAHLDRIAAADRDVHAFLHVDTDGALAAARKADEDRAAGEPPPPLAGVPQALKDALTPSDTPTTCGAQAQDDSE